MNIENVVTVKLEIQVCSSNEPLLGDPKIKE